MEDFRIVKGVKRTHDPSIPFMFNSKDGNVTANFFWIPDDVQLRGLYGEHGTIHIGYPFANYRGGGVLSDVKPERVLNSLVRRLKEIRKYG